MILYPIAISGILLKIYRHSLLSFPPKPLMDYVMLISRGRAKY